MHNSLENKDENAWAGVVQIYGEHNRRESGVTAFIGPLTSILPAE